jgi:ankyrin repeat protein
MPPCSHMVHEWKDLRVEWANSIAASEGQLPPDEQYVLVKPTCTTWAMSAKYLAAARDGNLALVIWLVTKGFVCMESKDENGFTAAFMAAVGGHLPTLKWILAETTLLVCDGDNTGRKVIHAAAWASKRPWKGSVDTVEWLVTEGGASITDCDCFGATAMLVAAEAGNVEVLQWLVNKGGASVDEKNKNGMSTLMVAAKGGEWMAMAWLLDNGCPGVEVVCAQQGKSAFLYAAMAGRVNAMEWLLARAGADIGATDSRGRSAMLLAAQNGRLEALKWLVTAGGARIRDTDAKGQNALHLAAEAGQLRVIPWLVDEGQLDVDEKSTNGSAAVMYAAEHSWYGVVEWLLLYGGASFKGNDGGEAGMELWTWLQLDLAEFKMAEKVTAVLRVLSVLGEVPVACRSRMTRAQLEIVKRGREIAERLPEWEASLREALQAHCPVPSVIVTLIADYAEPVGGDLWVEKSAEFFKQLA